MEKVKPRIIFRADGDAKTGLGHLFRMAALAQLIGNNFIRVFYTRARSEFISRDIQASFDALIELDNSKSLGQEAVDLANEMERSDVLVVDGYNLDALYQESFLKKGIRVVMMDDYHINPILADIVINIAGGSVASDYSASFYTQLLFGFKASLLRSEFRQKARDSYIGKRSGFFICLGGANPSNRVLEVTKEVRRRSPEEIIHVVLGSAYVFKDQFIQQFASDPLIHIHHSLSAKELSDLMQTASVGFCSSSTIAYEFLCCNERLVVDQTADNQKNLFSNLITSGAALSWDSWISGESFGENSPVLDWRNAMLGFSYPELFQRIAEDAFWELERASEADLDLYFNWANDPATRAQSFSSEAIPYEDHCRWFRQKIKDPSVLFLKMIRNNVPVAQIRYVFSENEALVNYSVSAEWRGKGLSVRLLRDSMRYLYHHHPHVAIVKGYVKPDNIPSAKAFRRLHFHEQLVERNGEKSLLFEMELRKWITPSSYLAE